MCCITIKIDFALYKTLNRIILRYWASGEGLEKGKNHARKGKTPDEVVVSYQCGAELDLHHRGHHQVSEATGNIYAMSYWANINLALLKGKERSRNLGEI